MTIQVPADAGGFKVNHRQTHTAIAAIEFLALIRFRPPAECSTLSCFPLRTTESSARNGGQTSLVRGGTELNSRGALRILACPWKRANRSQGNCRLGLLADRRRNRRWRQKKTALGRPFPSAEHLLPDWDFRPRQRRQSPMRC